MKKLIYILLLFQSSGILLGQTVKQSIYLELKFEATPHSNSLPDSITIQFASYPVKLWNTQTIKAKHKSDAKWVIPIDKPIVLDVFRYRWFLEPNDSIVVFSREGKLHFSGRGADKLNMDNEISSLSDAMPKPFNPTIKTVLSAEDFLEWDKYLNRRMALSEFIMESYKDLVSPLAMYHTKVKTIVEIENQRWQKFNRLTKRKYFNLDRQVVTKLYDDHFFTPQARWVREQPIYSASQLTCYGRYFRQYNFADKYELIDNEIGGKLLVWEFVKKEYRGEALERFLAFYLTYYLIGKEGFVPLVDSTLKKYYADNNRDPEYQAYVKNYENKERILKKNRIVPEFRVYENKANACTRADLNGKVIVLHFIKSGNKASELIAKRLKKIEGNFENNPYIKFLHLPVNLQTDSVVRKFNLTGYPAVFVLDFSGRLITSSFIDSSLDAGKIKEIVGEQADVAKREIWQENHDGPYILSEGSTRRVYQYFNGRLSDSNLGPNKVQVASDEPGKYFFLNLRNSYPIEPSTFSQPEKLIAFSDIEGELEPLRLLLQKNKVIDEQYNWTFGKGHIVFVGDIFDRGEQVTECLWLLYSLEEKAKVAGGYVHVILGNHEIMNLSGDHKYTRAKYTMNAQMIGKSLAELYGKDSELGKWLRSKNIVEKIGDILFLHAGISEDINDLHLSVNQINELARPWYDNSNAAKKNNDRRLNLLFDNELSPFWYRNYYLDAPVKSNTANNMLNVSYKTPGNVVDNVLKLYEVNKIVTGHTHFEGVPDVDRGKYLTTHYSGKIINTDTFHKLGYSEALLVEDKKYYAVSKEGKRRDLKLNDSEIAATE